MFAYAHEPKRLWAVEGVGHEDIYFRTNEDYRRSVLAFFDANL
jgi:uncharacterized protein